MTLHATIVPLSIWFCTSISSFLCCLCGMENMQMEMGTLKKNCWHLSSLLPPEHTHIMCTPFNALSFWPTLVALSLLAVSQAHFNNCSHIASGLSFLLSILAPLSPTGQVLGQIDRMLPATVTNNTGLSHFEKRTVKLKVVCFEGRRLHRCLLSKCSRLTQDRRGACDCSTVVFCF